MRLKIEISLENAAFEDEPISEVRSVLSNLWQDAPALVVGVVLPLYDSNGNTVGVAVVVED